MYGLDLFSGIGGITKALEGYIEPVAYCEIDRYSQAVLLSRMSTGDLPMAPIWDDITTLRGFQLPRIDIVYGGFPCQDISTAGLREGLEGKRSRLFFEIIRLVSEIRPRFVFLENVSAITVRGAERVVREFCRLRYDCRWGVLSASDVGAPHKRDRWWFLANSRSVGGRRREEPEIKGQEITQVSREIPNTQSERCRKTGRVRCDESTERTSSGSETMADSKSKRDDGLQYWRKLNFKRSRKAVAYATSSISTGLPIRAEEAYAELGQSSWWTTEPNVGRVAHGVPARTHRLRALGNAVVPAQAREAFERLMGIKAV